MSKSRILSKARMGAFLCATLAGGTLFSGCSLTDVRDSLVDGSLSAIQGAASNVVDSILVNFNEFFAPIPEE